MMNFLRKYQREVLFSILAAMVIYIAVGAGVSIFSRGGPNEAVAEVDGEKIPLRLFYSHYERVLDQLPGDKRQDQKARQEKRDEAVRDLVQGVVFDRLAKTYGISVPDQQVVASL